MHDNWRQFIQEQWQAQLILLRERCLAHVAGSRYLPGRVRLAALRLAGGKIESVPGPGLIVAGDPRNVRVGHHTLLDRHVFIEAVGPVDIGSRCTIGTGVLVLTSHHAVDAQGRWDPEVTPRPVLIGDGTRVGPRAIVLPGATIGADVVIAPGAVVAGNCAAAGVYGGVPARLLVDDVGSTTRSDPRHCARPAPRE